MKLYRVRHKETGEFWNTNNKRFWEKSGSAKGAFTQHFENSTGIRFNEQDEYEIVEYILVETEKYERYREFIDKSFMDRNGFKVF